jgi:peroxiredoxin
MALTVTPFPEIGNPCPDFSLPAVDGKTYSKKDFAVGTPLVVMFICNHCPYVQAIEDRLIKLGQDLKAKKIPVLAICSNDEISHPEDSFENMQKRSRDKNYSFLYLHDKSQKVAKAFGAVCTPDFFVYDKNHQLAYRGRLDDAWKDASKVTRRELHDAVLQLAQGQTLNNEQTPSMGCSIKWV